MRFKTKPELGVDLVARAAGWQIAAAPLLGDRAYGESIALGERRHAANDVQRDATGDRAQQRPDVTTGVRAVRRLPQPQEGPPGSPPHQRP